MAKTAVVIKLGLLFSLLTVAAAVLFASVFLESETFSAWAKDELIQRLETRYPIRLSVNQLSFSLFRGALTVEGIQVNSPADSSQAPLCEVEKLSLYFDLFNGLRPQIRLGSLALERPRLRLQEDANHRLNILNLLVPEPSAEQVEPPYQPEQEAPVQKVRIANISIQQGVLLLESSSIGLDLRDASIESDLTFYPRNEEYRGFLKLGGPYFSVSGVDFTGLELSTHFSLFPRSLSFHSASINSDQVQGNFEGELSDFRELSYTFSPDLKCEPAKFASLDLERFVEVGIFATAGELTGHGSDFRYEGSVQADRFRTFNDLTVERFDAPVVLTKESVEIEQASFYLFDGPGRITGNIGWTESSKSSLSVELSKLRLRQGLSNLLDRSFPVTGTGDLTATLAWPGVDIAKAQIKGHLLYDGRVQNTPTLNTDTIEIPFVGAVQLDYQDGNLHLDQGTIETPGGQADYFGDLELSGAIALEGSIRSSDVTEIWSLIQQLGLIPADFLTEHPFKPTGPFSADLKLERTPERFDLESQMSFDQVSYKEISLGEVKGHLVVSPAVIQIEDLDLSGPSHQISGFLNFYRNQPESQPSVEGRFKADGLPLQEVVSLYTTEPVTGTASGEIELLYGGGTLSLRGPVRGKRIEWNGEVVEDIAASALYQDSRIELEDLQSSFLGGTVSGRAAFDLEAQSYDVDLTGARIELQRVQSLADLKDWGGTLDLDLRGEGSFSAPSLKVNISTPELSWQGESVRDLVVQADLQGGRAETQLKAYFLEEPISATGSIDIEPPYALNAELELSQVTLDRWLDHFLETSVNPFEGSTSARAKVSGNLSDLSTIRAEMLLSSLDLHFEDHRLRSPEASRFTFSKGILDVPDLHLEGPDTNFRVQGQLNLSGTRQINLNVKGQASLEVVNSFLEEGNLEGGILLDTDILGPMDEPRIVGTVKLLGNSLSHASLPIPLRKAEGELRFTANQISIDSIKAQTPYGPIEITGGVFLEGFTPSRWQFNAFGFAMQFEFPKDVYSVADLDLDLIKGPQSQLISGAIYLRSAEYTKDISLNALIAQLARSQPGTVRKASGDDVRIDVSIEAYRSLRIENNLADILASGELRFTGSVDNPVLLGNVTVDQGKLFLLGNEYEVGHGSISFSDPRKTSAFLNLEANTEIRDHTISALIRGPVDHPQISFRSDPPLATASIVALLTAGQTEEEIFGSRTSGKTASGTLAVYGAGAVLSKTLSEALQSQTSRLFGFERFSVDPFLDSGPGRDPGARITLGKQITRDISMTFITHLGSQLEGESLVIQYRLTDWLTAVGTRQEDGSIAVDFKFRKRF